MSLRDKVEAIEGPILEMETSAQALHFMADSLTDSEKALVRFFAHYVEGLHGKFERTYEAAREAIPDEHPSPRVVK